VAVLLGLAIYGVFRSGPIWTCIWGLVMAMTLFWMRSSHPVFYGITEVVAGLFILPQNYFVGRGGFSAGFFNEAYQTFQGNGFIVDPWSCLRDGEWLRQHQARTDGMKTTRGWHRRFGANHTARGTR